MSVKLMGEIWPLQFSPKSDKFVLLALADAVNDDDGFTYIAVRSRKAGKLDLMKKCSMSDRTIQGALNRLEEAGFIERVEIPGKGTIYRVYSTPEKPAGLTPEIFAPTPEAISGKPLYNHNERRAGLGNPVEKLGQCPLCGDALPDLLADENWRAYIAMRDAIGKPLTAYSARILIARLDDIAVGGWHPGDVCDRGTVNGWTDFFPPNPRRPSGVRRILGKQVGDPVGATDEDRERIAEIDALNDLDEQLRQRAEFFAASERRGEASSLGDVLQGLPLQFDPRKVRK